MQGLLHLAGSYAAAPGAIVAAAVIAPAVQATAVATAVYRRVVRWRWGGQRYLQYLFREPDPFQTPGAVGQATTATATGVLAVAGAADAIPPVIYNAAGGAIRELAAVPALVCATAASGAAAGQELLSPTKMTDEEVHNSLTELLLPSIHYYDP